MADGVAKKKMPLHNKIMIGLVSGAVCGLAAQKFIPKDVDPVTGKESMNAVLQWVIDNVFTHVGAIFLAMIFMIVVPLLLAALVLGVSEIGNAAKVGRIGLKALAFTIALSAIAVGLALGGVNLIRPGDGFSAEKRAELMAGYNKEEAEKKSGAEKPADVDPPVVGIVPKNPTLEATRALTGGLLPFMFFALIFGLAMTMSDPEKVAPVHAFFEGIFEISTKVIEIAMKLAPIGVFALVFKTGAILGLDAFVALLKYALLVIVLLAIHQFGVYSIFLKIFAKRNPMDFFRQMRKVMLTAFATSSSNATLPIALTAAEEDLGLPRDISSFVLTVGATANQNGTALFEGVTIIFLAQFLGVPLDLRAQVTVLMLAIVAGIGTAGVPGGSWPMIGSVLRMFAIDPTSIGICLGIDRILDPCRTVLNVTGDMTIACCVAASEGRGMVIPEEAME
jgi:DAACS family dicarboxylate/amino acid:cation (Na+ or H+) symporter